MGDMNICHADLNGDGNVEIANGAKAADVEIVFVQLEKNHFGYIACTTGVCG